MALTLNVTTLSKQTKKKHKLIALAGNSSAPSLNPTIRPTMVARSLKDLDLAGLNIGQGVKISGANGDQAGYSVKGAGDFNKDGYADVIIGAPYSSINGRANSGTSYLLFGSSSGLSNIDLLSLNATQGFKITGEKVGDYSGYSVSGAGDVNGDGYSDIVIKAIGPGISYSPGLGTSYVIFGKASGFADINLLSLSSTQGFRLLGAAGGDESTSSVASAGDVNGDGYSDIVIGASNASPNSRSQAGTTYVIFGKATGFADINLSSITSTQGFRLFGAANYEASGWSVASAGDINGDGYSDIVIGAPSGRKSYVIFGKATGFADIDLLSITNTKGFKIFGAAQYDYCGHSVASAGDVNGDGYSDIIIGSPNAGGYSTTSSAVIFGKAAGFTDINLSSLNSAQGFRLLNVGSSAYSGWSVSGAGDVNGDGYSDFVIGTSSNAAYIIYNSAASYSPSASPTVRPTAPTVSPSTQIPTAVPSFAPSYLTFPPTITPSVKPSIVSVAPTMVARALKSLDLAGINTGQGVKISGAITQDQAGYSVKGAGDFNKDGYADVIIGAPYSSINGKTNSGTSYLLFGSSSGLSNIDLLSLSSNQGFKITGENLGDNSGWSVASAGDVNGDGYSDIVIGAPNADPNLRGNSGTSYVIFGKATGFADIDLLSLTVAQGFRVLGAASGDNSGSTVASAGDINGDGYSDIVIGAIYASPNSRSQAGTSYVIFGKATSFADIDLLSLTSAQGFKILGAASGDNSGNSVASAGDINGDGYNDIVIGALKIGGYYGISTYVIFGKASGFIDIDLSSLSNTQGFRVFGAGNGYNLIGYSVSGAGDVNGDGYSDIVIGTYQASLTSTNSAGTSYVMFGKASGFTDINLSSLNSTRGFRVIGVAASDASGSSVASAGDVNGDGYSDIVIGAYLADPKSRTDAGTAYVIFGKASGFTDINLASLTSTQGFNILGAASGDNSGNSVASAGDVNGDGYSDIVIGASGASPNSRSYAGAAYIIYNSAASYSPSASPTRTPTRTPTFFPTGQPSSQPSRQPTTQPSTQPSKQPIVYPTSCPTGQPSSKPSVPTSLPSTLPSTQPSSQPTVQPSSQPSAQPSSLPSMQPTSHPSAQPSSQPSVQPSDQPTALPSVQPTMQPSGQPSVQPTVQPSGQPSALPSSQPSMQPSSQPSTQPSAQPTIQPSGHPSAHPSVQPSEQPSTQPSMQPSSQPTAQPSSLPSMQPNSQPSAQPSSQPTAQPSVQPTMQPSGHPSALPSSQPSMQPSSQPSAQPSAHPTIQPSMQPSDQPTAQPSVQPTVQPSGQPSVQPSAQPTGQPSAQPISKPTAQPSGQPSVRPSSQPTVQPSTHPSMQPSSKPSYHPSSRPTSTPSIKLLPGKTHKPSKVPSYRPTFQPTFNPTNSPTKITFTVTGNINNFKIKNSLLGYYKNSKSSLSDVVIPKASLGINYLIYGSKKTPRDIDLSKENNGLFSPIKESPLSLDQTTRSLSLIGDFNGDGFDDLLLGDPFNSKTYVFYGNQAGFTNMDLGFINFGEKATDFYGWSVASAKDFNGDGYPDLVTSALTAKKVYITFGKGSISRNVNLLSMTSDQGIIVSNSVQGYLCIDVEGIGDINLDGYNDIAITATQSSASSVYVIFGNKHPQNINLSLLTQKQGFVIAAQIQTILSLAFLGDVNQDGVSDFAIGGLSLNSNSEQNSYIVYGQKNISSFSLEKLDVNQGFKILGAGFFVNGPVDLNKDGINDILIVNLLNWRSNSATYIITYPHNITSAPTLLPSSRPSSIPSLEPTGTPSCNPSSNPTVEDSTSGQEVSLSPTTRHSGPTVLPSYAPSRTCRPSKVPTFLPSKTNRPSSNTPTIMRSVAPITHAPSYKPSCKPSKDPTISPSSDIQAGYITAYVSKANVYKAPNSKSLLIINSTNDVMIIAGNAPYVYKIIPTPRVVIIINNFKLNQDKIDLFQFKNIQSIKDLNYQVPPLNIKLDNQQKLIIYSQKSFELKENNFIFAPAGDQNKNSDSKENLISSLTSGLTLIGLAGFVAVANGLKNLFGIKIEEISSHEDSDLNELEKGKIDDNSDDLGKEVAQHSNFQNEEKYDNSDLDSLLSEDSFFLSITDQKSSSLVFTRSNSENSIVEYIQETYPEAVSDDHAWLNANSDEDTIINFMEGASPENYEDLLELIGQQEENA